MSTKPIVRSIGQKPIKKPFRSIGTETAKVQYDRLMSQTFRLPASGNLRKQTSQLRYIPLLFRRWKTLCRTAYRSFYHSL